MKVETGDEAGCRLKLFGRLRGRQGLKDPRHEEVEVGGTRGLGSRSSETEAKSRQALACPGKAITVSSFARRMMAAPQIFRPLPRPLANIQRYRLVQCF